MADTTITSITPIEGGRTVMGNKRILFADILFDGGTWPTSTGVPLTPSQFGMAGLDAVVITGSSQANYKWASNTLQAYVSGTAGAAMAIKAIVIDETIRIMAIGYGLA